MQGRQEEEKPSLLRRLGNKIIPFIGGYGAAIPNMQFAATFPYTPELAAAAVTEISYNWFINLSYDSQIASTFNMGSTLVVSGTYAFICLQDAGNIFVDHTKDAIAGKNRAKFIAECLFTFASALTGGAISGGPYSGVLKWVFRALGFTTVGGLSFLGVSELLNNLLDADVAFKKELVNTYLKRVQPNYRAEVDALLNNKELNEETIHGFLNALFTQAHQLFPERLIHSEELNSFIDEQAQDDGGYFQPFTESEETIQLTKTVADYSIATFFSACASVIYTQGGFDGLNVLTFDSLNDLPDAAKIASAFPVGFPLSLFAFFSLKFFKSSVLPRVAEIDSPAKVAKLALLASVNFGNACWYFGVTGAIADNENIFKFLLTSKSALTMLQVANFITCFNMGFQGLFPRVFPVTINYAKPQLEDVIKYLEQPNTPKHVYYPLYRHPFFKRKGYEVGEESKSVVAPRPRRLAFVGSDTP